MQSRDYHIEYHRLPKEKRRELLIVSEVKKMIYNEIQRKQKPVDPEKFNMRIVEDSLAEVEAMQFILAMIIDEENRRRNGSTGAGRLGVSGGNQTNQHQYGTKRVAARCRTELLDASPRMSIKVILQALVLYSLPYCILHQACLTMLCVSDYSRMRQECM
ncbi:MAG: hypothetical protein WBP64_15690 [Nitrososphaeraceae archaeon]